ncbi:16S rRNA (cytosine(967)-C(5))-methyltransferase RsmB [Ruminococcus sp. Marseille-P6503]|uniref:16S rRNA (cytosine(967)-C(5))-methyltransferase RsmB n=1 Tax=Ruminococcus sp. Marseille-P6503 TaxID=2364796 RepID=UPI000F51B723|nr:16S rRNA (cytosine(967)-C(5))-methyltransferase RsmB [Ruminococcus sp. Marseille-P6503]
MENSRKTVLRLLTKLESKSSYSNILLDDALKKSELSIQDKRFAAALFYGVLERRLTLDRLIEKYSRKPGNRLSAEVRNILRMGFYQLLYMDSVPDSAAVDEAVKLAKNGRNAAVSGFVNGMLREFIRGGKKLPKGRSETEKLSIEYSCPEWLVKKWLDEYGREAAMALLESSVGQAPVTVRANTLKGSVEDIISVLQGDGFDCERIGYADGCIKIRGCGSVERSEAYKKGLVHVQDLSSQICCEALNARRGEVVLDMCSAPGGKAFTVAQLMGDEGEIYAYDLHESRVRLIKSGAERLGISIIRAAANDAKFFNGSIPYADRILCDVPCSGLGVIRRKPEIKYKNPDDFERLPDLQYKILDISSGYLKPGGTVVYSTCTCSRAENDMVIERFLSEHSDFEPCALGIRAVGLENDYKVTITPEKFGSDGFFIAKLRKLR